MDREREEKLENIYTYISSHFPEQSRLQPHPLINSSSVNATHGTGAVRCRVELSSVNAVYIIVLFLVFDSQLGPSSFSACNK